METEVNKINGQLNSLRSDEDRQRANVTALNNAEKSARERFVHDLNATEDQIAATQKELSAAQANVDAARAELTEKIESLQLDQDLSTGTAS
jgi:chromosome segregation ATPase